jgi:translation initiation factor 1
MRDTDLNSRLVYSTSDGSICPGCGKPVAACMCREIKKAAVAKTDGMVRLRYETKGRKGKGMTLITGMALSEDGLTDLAKKLKQRFGTGGAVKNFTIELQGDHRQEAAEELTKLGYTVRQ